MSNPSHDMPTPHFPLDSWWPRKRGRRPGPRLHSRPDNWRFPSGFPRDRIREIIRIYDEAQYKINEEIRSKLPITEDERNRLTAEYYNEDNQLLRWPCRAFTAPDQSPEDLALDECHDVCWKVCALYVAVPYANKAMCQIYEYLDTKWFQGVKTWVFCDSFMVKGIISTTKDHTELTDYHKKLCDAVTARQGVLTPRDAEKHGQLDASRAMLKNTFWSHADYHFLPIFRRFFVIVTSLATDETGTLLPNEAAYSEATARLVFTEDATASLAIDPIDLEGLSTQYDVERDGNVLTGKLSVVADIILALWAEEKQKQADILRVAEELDSRLRFIIRDGGDAQAKPREVHRWPYSE